VVKDDLNKGGIKIHTPDPAAYHPGHTGYGTTIPSSTKDGGSLGFNPHVPGLVIVDPDMEDGNKVVDYAKFAKHKERFNVKINEIGGSDAESAFRAIVEAAADIEKFEEAERVSAVSTGSSGTTSKGKAEMVKDRITLSPDIDAVAREPHRSPGPVEAVNPSSAVVSVIPGLSQQLANQTEVLSQMAGLLANMHSSTQPVSPPPHSGPVEVQTIAQVKEEVHDEEVRDKVISGFETLEMSFVNGPLPIKPKKEVYFEMPNMGTMAARYHEIQDGGTCLALIYDTRYEDGYQFMPPALGDVKIKMTVPRENKIYYCSSVGIHFNCGVLDIVVLFKHTQEDDSMEEIR